ncbi:MAG: aminotransferase class I/II-fold pyridoxal phosphate-dependent enzyme [Lachnospiraceae bacterium]|nr:aminotransferase class I/II-fold pyridoxal phosphate-dependent enzyme [Lachnospiraceae bacterium]
MGHGGDIFRNKVNIDFSVNLNPYDVTDKILYMLEQSKDDIGHYPDNEQESLRYHLSKAEGVGFDQVFAGNGASEILLAIIRAILPKKALIIKPCFSLYRDYLRTIGDCEIKEVWLKKEDGYIITKDILSYFTEDIDIVFLTDPWNPVGLNIDNDILDKILIKTKRSGIKVILDQSFLYMSDKAKEGFDTLEFLNRYENLLIVRSYTKCFACPGIRMGYVLASGENIKSIRAQLPEWNMSVISENVMKGCADLSCDDNFISSSISLIDKERDYLSGELEKLKFEVFKSDTAFIMFYSKIKLYEAMLDKGILIRDLSDMFDESGYYRVAVKDHLSNEILIRCLGEVINGY